MRIPSFSKTFKKDYLKAKKQKKDLLSLERVMNDLIIGKHLNAKFLDHPLKGNWVNFRECHIQNDFLLIYKIEENTVRFERLGTHSELFR